MAEEHRNDVAEGETKNRGLFGFGDKEEKHQEEVLVGEFVKVKVVEEEEEQKKHGLLEKLRRSDSSSSSSSDEEDPAGEGENKEKRRKKKGLKDKLKEKICGEKEGEKVGVVVAEHEVVTSAESDTAVHIEKVDEKIEVVESHEEKKGFLEKIKDKLPGQHKKPAEEGGAAHVEVAKEQEELKEKKGFLGKIMDKIPGYHKGEQAQGGGDQHAAPAH